MLWMCTSLPAILYAAILYAAKVCCQISCPLLRDVWIRAQAILWISAQAMCSLPLSLYNQTIAFICRFLPMEGCLPALSLEWLHLHPNWSHHWSSMYAFTQSLCACFMSSMSADVMHVRNTWKSLLHGSAQGMEPPPVACEIGTFLRWILVLANSVSVLFWMGPTPFFCSTCLLSPSLRVTWMLQDLEMMSASCGNCYGICHGNCPFFSKSVAITDSYVVKLSCEIKFF